MSKIGESNSYFLVIIFLMWCVHYGKFSAMAFLVPLSGLLTAGLKYGIQMPRPYHISDKIDLINGYGMPSGHAISAVVFWGYLPHAFKKKWFYIVSIFLVISISISRIYRNSHYPSQILAGLMIGLLVLWLCIHYQAKIRLFVYNLSILKAWAVVMILPLCLIGLTAIMMLFKFDGSGMEDIEGVFCNAGLLIGFSIGLYLMQRKGGIHSGVPILKQLIKILIIALSFFIAGYVNKYAAKAYDVSLWVGSTAVLIANYFVALWFCYYGPLLLTKLKLFRIQNCDG